MSVISSKAPGFPPWIGFSLDWHPGQNQIPQPLPKSGWNLGQYVQSLKIRLFLIGNKTACPLQTPVLSNCCFEGRSRPRVRLVEYTCVWGLCPQNHPEFPFPVVCSDRPEADYSEFIWPARAAPQTCRSSHAGKDIWSESQHTAAVGAPHHVPVQTLVAVWDKTLKCQSSSQNVADEICLSYL